MFPVPHCLLFLPGAKLPGTSEIRSGWKEKNWLARESIRAICFHPHGPVAERCISVTALGTVKGPASLATTWCSCGQKVGGSNDLLQVLKNEDRNYL